jgi:hypothetical protein
MVVSLKIIGCLLFNCIIFTVTTSLCIGISYIKNANNVLTHVSIVLGAISFLLCLALSKLSYPVYLLYYDKLDSDSESDEELNYNLISDTT